MIRLYDGVVTGGEPGPSIPAFHHLRATEHESVDD